MIRYQLRCDAQHQFEGWFRSSADFDRQEVARLVSCPQCGSVGVTRALMAPSVVGSPKRRAPAGSTAGPDAGAGTAVAPGTTGAPGAGAAGAVAVPSRRPPARMPDALRAMLSRMRETVERECDYVGPGFADEALRMHRGETETRAIYGEATDAERESLDQEGVAVARIPWLPRADG